MLKHNKKLVSAGNIPTAAYVMSAVVNVPETVANVKLPIVNVIDPQNPLLQLRHNVRQYIT